MDWESNSSFDHLSHIESESFSEDFEVKNNNSFLISHFQHKQDPTSQFTTRLDHLGNPIDQIGLGQHRRARDESLNRGKTFATHIA